MCILTICTAHLQNVWLGWPAVLQRVFSICRHDAPQRAWEEPARGTKPPELCVYIHVHGCRVGALQSSRGARSPTESRSHMCGLKPYREPGMNRREARSRSN